MKIKNPSQKLQAILAISAHITSRGYVATCRSNTCSHASHDPGYDWIEVDGIPADLAKRICRIPGNPHSHEWHCLPEELEGQPIHQEAACSIDWKS